VLIVDGALSVNDERGPGGMLNLIEPLPGGDDHPADDQASQRKHDTGAAVLGRGDSVDRPDHGLQRLINLRHTPALGHAKIIYPPRPIKHSFVAPSAVWHGRLFDASHGDLFDEPVGAVPSAQYPPGSAPDSRGDLAGRGYRAQAAVVLEAASDRC